MQGIQSEPICSISLVSDISAALSMTTLKIYLFYFFIKPGKEPDLQDLIYKDDLAKKSQHMSSGRT